jgi:O-methyltransferase involved in polyketide biosynthesis
MRQGSTDIRHLSSISETLVLPLCYRAMESQRPDALIHDPKAAEIVAQLAYDFARIKRQSFQQLNIALRVREFDCSARAFLADHPDGVVVDVGCGLDTRFERVDNGRVRWFNLDLPEVIALRERFLPPGPRCQDLASSALDFGWMETVVRAGGPYLFLSEGVLPYFAESEVKQFVLALCRHFPGSEFVFDAIPPLMARFGRLHPAIRQTRAARACWGLDDSRALERWAPGLRLLADWRYYAQDEPRLGWHRLLRHVPVVRGFRVLHYGLGARTSA